jgi:hypothetical protein
MANLCEVSLNIPATPEAIWSVLVDLKRLPEWLPVKVDLEYPQGATAAPGVFIKVQRDSAMGRVQLEQVFEHVDAPSVLTWKNRHETLAGKPVTQIKDFSTAMTLKRLAENQTQLTLRSEWTPVGMMGAMANSFLKPKLKQEYEAALANIARLATSAPTQ